jgi:hypothetical protein
MIRLQIILISLQFLKLYFDPWSSFSSMQELS